MYLCVILSVEGHICYELTETQANRKHFIIYTYITVEVRATTASGTCCIFSVLLCLYLLVFIRPATPKTTSNPTLQTYIAMWSAKGLRGRCVCCVHQLWSRMGSLRELELWLWLWLWLGGSYHHSSISLMDKVLSESVVPWKSLYIKWDQGINRRVNTFEDQRII